MSTALESLFSRGPIPILEKTIRFTETRHKYIVGNIANADTPGYRRQDLSAQAFESELSRAIERTRSGSADTFSFDDREGIQSSDLVGPRFRILENNLQTDHGVLRHDGNNVDVEREMVLLQKNSGRLKRSADLLKKYLGMIRAAVTESPR